MLAKRLAKGRLKVEIISIIPNLMAHCQHCMDVVHGVGLKPYQEQFEQYPRDVIDTYYKICEIVDRLLNDVGDKVHLEVLDTTSFQGVWKSAKYRVKRTPCFVVNGKKVYEKIPDYNELKTKILEEMSTSSIS